ncbi:hypothetical protein C5167_026046 [Papaver somniferum]|uniref:polyphenol oxidase I, chloroplastic-like n=1 Tax=Papaver somniferum TaxID=3469 RepID=UPI000E7058EC|nr:polyphenol oxidase I, chloroplastic-like [Papaver somniferum]RZC93437.1 hypothetical protein C5167_026046 [Papaver somniferum]
MSAMEANTKWMSRTKVVLLMLCLVAAVSLTVTVFHVYDQNQQLNNQDFVTTGNLKEAFQLKIEIGYISAASNWLKNLIFNGFWGGRNGPTNSEIISGGENHEGLDLDLDRRVISPNLSSCHDSHAVPDGTMINCCPPKPESEEDIIDFELPAPSTLRVRRPAHLLDDEYIAKYEKAVAIMRSLPYTDPRSFKRQANLHCIYCTGSYNQKYSNSIPFYVHRNWYFFPWHRMFLYFHEKILGDLIGDENFTLPFWQWDTPEGMSFPSMYMKGALVDKERNPSHLSPQSTVDLSYHYNETELSRGDLISSNLAFLYNQFVSAATTYELFMGCPFKVGEAGECYALGTMEAAPHDTVHGWVGKLSNNYHQNMGAFFSAARDPTFFAHHANIDRIWEVWRKLGNYKRDIVDPDWLNAYFYFHNEKSQLVRIRVHQILNITAMGYRYQKVDLPWLNVKPKPSVSPKNAQNKPKMNMKNYSTGGSDQELNNVLQLVTEKSSCFEPNGRTLDNNLKVRVYRPRKNRSKKDMEEEEEILVVYGIDVKTDMFVKFDVFINLGLDGCEKTSDINLGPESREFAGTYVKLHDGVRKVMNEGETMTERKSKTDLKLGISELLKDLEADEDESILVTLVPRNGSGVNTTIDGARIDFMPRYTQ